MVAPHNILMLAPPNSRLLDVTGSFQMFAAANEPCRVKTKGRQKCRSSISALSSSPV